MILLQQSRKILTTIVLILVLTITTACGGGNVSQVDRTTNPSIVGRDVTYSELERGNSPSGQSFGNWVVQTSQGLIQDAYVRDNNKLGVVISSQVRPNEVKPLAKSLVQGFKKNFPNQDLQVLMYGPDKKLILTANYDNQSNQIKYS
jgi:ABC-type phosphate transport system substrate-binding protein